MYSVLCNFITYVALCIHRHSQDTEEFHHHKNPSCSFITTPTSLLPHPSLTLNSHYCSLYLLFVILRMSYKYNYIVCIFLSLSFLTHHNLIQMCITTHSFLLLSSILWYGYIPVYLIIHPMKYIQVVSSVLLLQIKMILIFVYRFLCGYNLLSLWDKCPRV